MTNYFPPSKKIIVSIPTALLTGFDAYCLKVGANRSEMLRQVIREYMAKHDIPIIAPKTSSAPVNEQIGQNNPPTLRG